MSAARHSGAGQDSSAPLPVCLSTRTRPWGSTCPQPALCLLHPTAGNVERVTDLIELLQRVKSTKAAELSSAILPGDAIAFDDVDIYTPADVLLVKGLSFRLEVGQVAAPCALPAARLRSSDSSLSQTHRAVPDMVNSCC